MSKFFTGKHVASKTLTAHVATSFKNLVDSLIKNPFILVITYLQFWALNEGQRKEAKKKIPYLVACTFPSSPCEGRNTEHAGDCCLLFVDVDDSDHARPFVKTPRLLSQLMDGFNFVVYHTLSSTYTKPRLRVMVEASDIPPDRYREAVQTIGGLLGLPYVTRESGVVTQPMFIPAIFKDHVPGIDDDPLVAAHFDGRAFTIEDIATDETSLSPLVSRGKPVALARIAIDAEDDFLRFHKEPDFKFTLDMLRDALKHIPADCDRAKWVEIFLAAKHQFGDDPVALDILDEWSRTGSKYVDRADCETNWRSAKEMPVGRRPITIGSLIKRAMEGGWMHAELMRPLTAYSGSDLGNAEAIVSRIGINIRYVPKQDNWLMWGGYRWRVDSTDTWLNQMVDVCAKEWLREAADIDDDERKKKAVKRALSLGDRKTRSAALEMMKHQSRIIMDGDAVDADPWLLGLPNGILDLKECVLLTNAREHHITKSITTDFDPSAKCPQWEKFIERVTQGHDGLADFLQRSIGYSLTGLTAEHVFWFLHGCGKNGKSVFIETMQLLSGEYGRRASDRLLSISKFGGEAPLDELAGLPGVRMLFGSETADGVRLNEKLVKDLTGGDTLRGRRLYNDGFDFRPVCKLWLFGNHKPEICGTDHGIWRRVLLVPFTACISNEEQDNQLAAKLSAELPGILNWALAGLRQYHDIGLAPPHCVTAATNEYKSDQDTLGDFIDECLERGQGFTASKAVIYQAYDRWARTCGQRLPLTSKRLSRQLKERGFIELPSRMWAEFRIREDLPFDHLEPFSTKPVHGE
jgi:putative DNA primase/helicase